MLSALALHKSWIIFVGTFFLGESVILAAAALAAHGSWSVWAVVGWAFAGTLVSDAVWFHSAHRGVSRFRSTPERSARLDRATARLDRLVGEHPHRALLFIKFVYGTRIASIVYLASRHVPTARFNTFNAIGVTVWLAVIVPIGYVIGQGVDRLGVDLARVERAILAVVVVAAMWRGVMSWRNRAA